MKYLPLILLAIGGVAAVYFLYYKPAKEQAAADTERAMQDMKADLLKVPVYKFAGTDPAILKAPAKAVKSAVSIKI